MKLTYIWVAQFESEHYSWTATGRTKQEAMDGLKKRWNRHSEQTGCPKWNKKSSEYHGSTPAEYYAPHAFRRKIGEGYMDSEDEEDSKNG